MLPKRYRLRRSADIRRVRAEGKLWRHPLVLLFAQATGRDVSRFGISVSRYVGNAVTRNRAKRLVREGLRRHLDQIPAGWDCLFVIRRQFPGASFADVEQAILRLLARAGLLLPDASSAPTRT